MHIRRLLSSIILANALLFAPLGGEFSAHAQWFDWLFKPKPAPPTSSAPPPSRPRSTPPNPSRGAVIQPTKPVIQSLTLAQERAILQLSESFGSLAFLAQLCAHDAREYPKDGQENLWVQRMENLLASDGDAFGLREKMIGSYNQGYLAYAISYRQCTGMAEAAKTLLLKDVLDHAQLVQQIL